MIDPVARDGTFKDKGAAGTASSAKAALAVDLFQPAAKLGHPPVRDRKLLLHRREIEKIDRRVREKGITLVPLELFFAGHLVKLGLALAQGKKLYDKRHDQAKKDAKRQMDRAMGRRR